MRRKGTEVGISAAARLLGLSMTHVYRLIYEGKLPAQKRGRSRRISRAVLDRRLHRAPMRSVKAGSSDFWKQKTIQQLAAEQGIDPATQLEKVWGAGVGLWKSDREFEDFVDGIYRRRREDRERETRS